MSGMAQWKKRKKRRVEAASVENSSPFSEKILSAVFHAFAFFGEKQKEARKNSVEAFDEIIKD